MGVDFFNKKIFKLAQENPQNGLSAVANLLIEGEEVIGSYVSMRDRVVFTNKRLISINVQGLTGSKKDFTSFPYNKIQFFSVETAGTVDLDSELEIFLSGGTDMKFEFMGNCNIQAIGQMISRYIL